jgi:hypothetical protein
MPTPSGFQPRPLKNLFTANQCWPALLEAGGLRDIEVEAVIKMLACSTKAPSNPSCCRPVVRSGTFTCRKKTANGRKTVNYLGRYLKKPPISGSRLAHYSASPTGEF